MEALELAVSSVTGDVPLTLDGCAARINEARKAFLAEAERHEAERPGSIAAGWRDLAKLTQETLGELTGARNRGGAPLVRVKFRNWQAACVKRLDALIGQGAGLAGMEQMGERADKSPTARA